MSSGTFRRVLIAGAVAAVGTAGVLPGVTSSSPAAAALPMPIPAITGNVVGHLSGSQVPTTADCIATFGIPCYSGVQLEHHYGLTSLYAEGLTGAGKTIVIVDAFGSPTIQADLETFDAAQHLPNPLLTIIQPVGAIPPFDPNNSTMVGWAEETTLDVEMSHAIAPGAHILLVETPIAETEGQTGFPAIVHAENYVVDHHLGDVISQSFGATEQTFPSQASIYNLRSAYANAWNNGITVLASSGDTGATNDYGDSSCCYASQVDSWPSTDPLVTSVGGTQIHVNASGSGPAPVARDTVWNDPNSLFNPGDPTTLGASGGGISSVFQRPEYQNSVRAVVGTQRGTPDISMSAAVDGAALVYMSFAPLGPGWELFGGTSEASPLFAGIVAIAAQDAGHDLGLINRKLYSLENKPDSGVVDVTRGNNTLVFDNAHKNGALTTVDGFDAAAGYDLASGLGTIWAPEFVPALAGK
jgi:subtilase family serine protease